MAALILPSRRVAQPQGGGAIDFGSSLSRGIVFALSGVDGADRVKGGAITRTASLSAGVTRYGFGFSSSTNSAFSKPLDLSGTSEITVSFVLVLRASTTAVLVEHTANYGTNAGSFLIYTDGGNFLAGVSNGAGGATGFNLSKCPAPALNVPVRVVATLRRLGTAAKACRIWFDGVEQSTTQPNNGAISGNFANSTTYFLGRGASSIFANAIIQDPAIFGRLLSDGEAALLSRNPWQLFKPVERRIWVPASTGGGTAYSLSADVGSYSLSGQDAGLVYAPGSGTYSLTADFGTYNLSGFDAGVSVGRNLLAGFGEYPLSGQDSASVLLRVLPADFGSYSIDGQSATLTATGSIAYSLAAETGLYSLDGQAASLVGPASDFIDTHDGFWSRQWAKAAENARRKETIEELEEELEEIEEQIAEVKAAPVPKKPIYVQSVKIPPIEARVRLIEKLIQKAAQIRAEIEEEEDILLLL